MHRGPWTPREDALLTNYIQAHGEGIWRSLPKRAGLLRCGKSCRLRWMNYLRPDRYKERKHNSRRRPYNTNAFASW